MRYKRMKKCNVDDDSICPFDYSPDEIVLEILNKVMDLKTLCVCEAVSKRFYAIVHQVRVICYTTPFSYSLICNDIIKLKSFNYAIESMIKFNRVKSVCIQCQGSVTANSNNIIFDNNKGNGVLYKWKVKMGKNKVDSLVFVSPSSVYDNNGLLLNEKKENVELRWKFKIAMCCLGEARLRVRLLRRITINLPSLEKVSIADSDYKEMICVNGRENIDELRNLKFGNSYYRLRKCFLSSLELPLSGYMMKGITLFLVEDYDVPDDDGIIDWFINDEIDFKHDKEEVAYHEAIMEIFKKHRDSIVTCEEIP